MHNRKDGLSINRHGQRCVKTYLEALLMVFMQDGGDDDGDEMGLVCRCIGFKSLMYEMWPGLRRDHDYEMEW